MVVFGFMICGLDLFLWYFGGIRIIASQADLVGSDVKYGDIIIEKRVAQNDPVHAVKQIETALELLGTRLSRGQESAHGQLLAFHRKEELTER